MDALDRRILSEVQVDASITASELAERCATTESTALRRLKQLRRDGTIRSEVALVDPSRVGRPLLIFVGVRLERESGPEAEAFIDRIRSHRDVQQFYFVTGTPDYLILLCVRSMADYDQFLQDCLIPDPIVVATETNVVIRSIKSSTVVPID